MLDVRQLKHVVRSERRTFPLQTGASALTMSAICMEEEEEIHYVHTASKGL